MASSMLRYFAIFFCAITTLTQPSFAGMKAQGLSPSGILTEQELIQTDTELATEIETEKNEINDQLTDIETWSSQFSPNRYRREVVGTRCEQLKEGVQTDPNQPQEYAACRQHYQDLQPKSHEDFLQELAEDVNISPEAKPYFCPEQYPHPTSVPRRCISSREFDLYGGWIHTLVSRSSPLYTDTDISYSVVSGPCEITVGGVITPTGLGECVVKATERFNAEVSRDSDPLTLTIFDSCPGRDTPFTISASSQQATVGESIQITGSGGGLARCQANEADHEFFSSPSTVCSVGRTSGEVTSLRAGECTITAYNSGLINDEYAQTVTLEFNDPESTGELILSFSDSSPSAGETVNLIVTGASPDATVTFNSSDSIACSTSTNATVRGNRDITCLITARVIGGESTSRCLTFGRGSVNPPAGCRPDGWSDGPFELFNSLGIGQVLASPSGNGLVSELHEVGYRGGNGQDLGLITLSLAEPNTDCHVHSGAFVSATANTVCKVRAYSGGLAQYSNNWVCIPFGTATLSSACETENAGGTSASDFDFSGTQTAAVGSNVTLTGLNLGSGGTADWDLDPDTLNCYFTDLNDVGGWPSAYQLSSVKIHHRENQGDGTCRVKAWRTGFPDEAVTKCFVFGDITVSDMDACVADAPQDASADIGPFGVVVSSTQVAVDGSIEVSATGIEVGDEAEDSYSLRVVNSYYCQARDYQTRIYASGSYVSGFTISSRNDEGRVCKITATKYDNGLAGESRSVCVQFGDGGPEENLPAGCSLSSN